MEILISLILVVFGVLQIILFFKVWDMCNNVKKISTKFKANYSRDFELEKALLKGDKDLAVKLLTENAFDEYLETKYDSNNYEKNHRLNFIIERYEKKFVELGVEMPKTIQNIKISNDIMNLTTDKYTI